MAPKNVDFASPAAPMLEAVSDPPQDTVHDAISEPNKTPPMRIVWRNVAIFAYLHLAAVYGLYLTPSAQRMTWAWSCMMYLLSAIGITAGAHRLWSHRSFQAKLPFRTFLAMCQTMASQNDIIEWARDHRVHHKYSETDADPHNAKRGFFFAHVGWLLVRKHPNVKAKGKAIDLSDLYQDPVCVYQRKYFKPLVIWFCFVLPTVVPMYLWEESFLHAFFVSAILRYVLVLNVTWLVNSAAHTYGNKPYDRSIHPAENAIVALGALGEGFHNYHHTFPQDYATSEYGWRVNPTCLLIDFMAAIGQVTHRKSMSKQVIEGRVRRTGDGTTWFNGIFGIFQHRNKDL